MSHGALLLRIVNDEPTTVSEGAMTVCVAMSANKRGNPCRSVTERLHLTCEEIAFAKLQFRLRCRDNGRTEPRTISVPRTDDDVWIFYRVLDVADL
jgi:hypothetical protein